MSELDPLTAKLLAEQNVKKKLTKEEWDRLVINIPAITLRNVINGSGSIVHLPKDHIKNWDTHHGTDDIDDGPDPQTQTRSPIRNDRKTTAPARTPAPGGGAEIMRFGKYRSKTHDWIKENDPGYWSWLTTNVPSMTKYA